MLRREFLAAVPALGLTAFAGRPRLSAPTTWGNEAAPKLTVLSQTGANGTQIFSLKTRKAVALPSMAAFGLRFAALPGFKHGVAFWRYAPWKSWTKPMAMTHAGNLESDDVQFAYWQYNDGVYGVALPLGGGGFRSTLGGKDGAFATVCRALGPAVTDRIMPQLAVHFGRDLFATISAVFEDAMTALGTPENLRKHKTLPESLTWLGWNTWNASNLGKDLSADWVIAQVDTIRAAGAPIRTVVLDDGHFEARDSALQSQSPNKLKFPNGFKPVVDSLLKGHGLKHVGLWHAFNAYWNGIDPQSELGQSLNGKLFTWTQKPSPIDTSGKTVTYSFLKPEPALLEGYFDAYHAGLKAAGFTLLKVDNQLVSERMASGNYPIWDLSKALHTAINKGAAKYFDNALINCMDMTNDAFLNFGTTAVARSVEDYFPYKPAETYDLQEGNAAAHCLQAMYNALYFGEMVFPDFDMFESTNPNAKLHAAVRAANCAPIYVTDKAGQHDVALLNSLVDHEGRTLRSDTPLRPVADCLFQIQAQHLFKASSLTGDGALLLLANLADADTVTGDWRLSDITGLKDGDYAVWSPRDSKVSRPSRQAAYAVTLPRFGHDLLVVAPVRNGRAVLGLENKLNSLAAVSVNHGPELQVTTRDTGTLLVWCDQAPTRVTVDGAATAIDYDGKLLRIALAGAPRACRVTVA
ncbi:hypothetical protein ABAC460_12815 [Asticcacaulis sp. AC460]|uniref:Sip1-related alpha-galactosidase n=1 Tax=Asticcacaulis sp. AC460 TaxID=1282360 RepID=UPI0003C3C3C2|nr:Sip1-related alpha-galactosidase [Asticcacaulis sp. AC460]ESQ89386.1 hypothetical protein ABAC460_12815 [Asticcacaulis sp. AC460]